VPLVLFVVFLVVPLLELYVIIQVGQQIGALWTVVLLLLVSVVGTWLVRREGVRAWSNFRAALQGGRPPTAEVVDGALVLFGGALLLTPGFLTDILGLALVFPPTRAVVSRAVRARVRSRFGVTGFMGAALSGRGRRRAGQPGSEPIDVEVEVVTRNDPDGR
jgi:UPF0716 protein FxsA